MNRDRLKTRGAVTTRVTDTIQRAGVMRAEVLVVLGVLLFLACLLLPAISITRDEADKTMIIDRMRHIGQHVQIYHDTYRSLPVASPVDPSSKPEQEAIPESSP